mmetsp:Transcript_4586/g.14595  ORF Transcript_4586/g.14595 Transcript_4586/m.14595 type:complete len:278 (+) Transcript_4586:845-1678(+)
MVRHDGAVWLRRHARAGDLLGAAQRGGAAGHPAVRRDHLEPLRWLHARLVRHRKGAVSPWVPQRRARLHHLRRPRVDRHQGTLRQRGGSGWADVLGGVRGQRLRFAAAGHRGVERGAGSAAARDAAAAAAAAASLAARWRRCLAAAAASLAVAAAAGRVARRGRRGRCCSARTRAILDEPLPVPQAQDDGVGELQHRVTDGRLLGGQRAVLLGRHGRRAREDGHARCGGAHVLCQRRRIERVRRRPRQPRRLPGADDAGDDPVRRLRREQLERAERP